MGTLGTAVQYRKPFPPVRWRVERPKKNMTIAAGFHFNGGLLFCVDTKVSTDIKTNESKLIYYTYADGECATAFAMSSDDLNFPRSACESCRDAVSKIDFSSASIESVRKAIQSALTKFYKEHIFPHPDRSANTIYLKFLIGIWLKGETRMFISHETVLNQVDDYECIGSGAYLAKYWIRQYQRANPSPLTVEDASLLASFAVKSAIDYDEYCGGEAELLIVKNSGEVDTSCETLLYPGISFIESLQQEAWKLLHDLAHVKSDRESETAYMLERYFDKVREIQDSYKWAFEIFNAKKNKSDTLGNTNND